MKFNGMTDHAVKYAGYRFESEGVYLRKKLRYKWAELSMVTTVLRPDKEEYASQLIFTVGGSLALSGAKVFSFGQRMGRYAEALTVACKQAPVEAEIDELTRDIARWGTREMRRSTKARTGERLDAEKWVERAQNQRAWMEHKKALKTVTRALEWQRDNSDALRLRLVLLGETDAKPAKLWQAAEDWANQYSNSDEAQVARGIMGLANNMPAIVVEVEHSLRIKPDQLALTDALAGFYYRKQDYIRAREVWETFAEAAADQGAGRLARENVEYLRRYESSPFFRWRERIKNWALISLAWLPMALSLGFWGYQAYREWHPEDQAMPPEMVEMVERMEQHKKEIERINRELQETTGLIAASDEALHQRAEAGEAAAQYTLATRLLRGNNPEEIKEGIANLEKSAAQDYRWAVLDLAEYLDEGEIVEQDVTRAVALFERAAGLGSPRAAQMAGEHYFKGQGVAVDKVKAFQYFKQSAAGGHTMGNTLMGYMLERGEGTPVDLEEAVNYYRQAAEDENVWAMKRLIIILYVIDHGPYDPIEAIKWIHRGAELGSANLQIYAVRLLMQKSSRTPDETTQALGWLDEQIAAGLAEALYLRGRLAWDGTMVPSDRADAVNWFELAVVKNYPPALSQMARCFAFGVEVERDPFKAQTLRDQFAATAGETGTSSLKELDEGLEAAGRQFSEKIPADQYPQAIWRQRPEYPLAFRKAGVTGSAQIRFTVGIDGFTENVRPVRATEPAFGAAAANAVLFWRFEPVVEPKMMEIPIIFTLQDLPSQQTGEDEANAAVDIDL